MNQQCSSSNGGLFARVTSPNLGSMAKVLNNKNEKVTKYTTFWMVWIPIIQRIIYGDDREKIEKIYFPENIDLESDLVDLHSL